MSCGVSQIPGRENHGNMWEVFIQGGNGKRRKSKRERERERERERKKRASVHSNCTMLVPRVPL